MKLHGHKRERVVNDAFVSFVICVIEPLLEALRYFLYRKTVILSSQITFISTAFHYRLILAPVTELEFVCHASHGERQNLITQTYPQCRYFFSDYFFNIFNSIYGL